MGDSVSAAPAPAAARPRRFDAALARRLAFGAALVTVAGGFLALDFATGRTFGFAALAAFAFVFGLREAFAMLRSVGPASPSAVVAPGLAYAAAIATVGAALAAHEAPPTIARRVPSPELVVALYVAALLGIELRGTPSRERLVSLALTLAGALYILLLGSFVLRVRALALPDGTDIGALSLLYVIVAAKGTDVFAFLSGRFLGGRKLIPRVSPGKTWAGAVGGLAGAALITCIFALFSDLGRVFHWTAAIPFGIMIGFSAQVGDLVESLIKRSAAVKDSGALVPEFGGVLDIVDCILFVAPVYYAGVRAMAQVAG